MSRVKTAKSFMFIGDCAHCGRNAKTSRGGVEIAIDRADPGVAWVCLKCADVIGKSIITAASECRGRLVTRQEFKHDRWRPKPKKTKGSAS